MEHDPSTDGDYYQGTWDLVEAEPRRIAGRKDGKAPRNFIDVEAFRRLAKRGFDGRPKDVRDAEAESPS